MERNQLKKIKGGDDQEILPEGSWCRATANCSNGSTVSLTCEKAQAGCVGIDSSSNNNGYAYCQQNGAFQSAHC